MKALRLFFIVILFARLAIPSQAGTLVQFFFFFGTSQYAGEVDAELYDKDKPVTTHNFTRLIQSGAYNGSFFHRCQPNFVLQGGGFAAFVPSLTNIIAPPYIDFTSVPNFGNITNEINVGKFYSNTNGTIAMAKTSDPNSANSQFFFNISNNSGSLDTTNNAGGFTVFGHVVRGGDLLNQFNGINYGGDLFDLTKAYGTNGALFSQLPANYPGSNPPPYNSLIYFSVNVLTANIAVTNGIRQISWIGVNGVTNNVEYTTNLSAASWQVLTNVVGGGTNVTVYDSTTNNVARFYRIHPLF